MFVNDAVKENKGDGASLLRQKEVAMVIRMGN